MGDSCEGAASRFDIPVFFRTLPGRAGDFLLLGQEKVTKELARILRARFGHFRRPLAVFEGPRLAQISCVWRRELMGRSRCGAERM